MQIPDYQDISDQQKVNVRELETMQNPSSSMHSWNELYLKDELRKAIRESGYEYPSQIQNQALPLIMQGKDVICQARAGTGKTAVYILGVLNQMVPVNGAQYQECSCIVVCPTRELAHQVFADFRRLSRHMKQPPLRIACFFGGISIEENLMMLEQCQYPHIVIGTPGRLKQLAFKHLKMHKVQYFVIDQCDQILNDLKMQSDVKQIIQRTKQSRQVMLLSATLTPDAQKYARDFINTSNYSQIFVDPGRLVIPGLSQFNIFLQEKDKFNKLMQLLTDLSYNQAIIFANRVEKVKKLNHLLKQKLFNPLCIHSNLGQFERIVNFDKFRENKSRFLVATDLFGRGLDIQRVNLVINYDLPISKEVYLHRVGRAGRFNTKGIAINFVCKIADPEQENVIQKDVLTMVQIEEALQKKIPELPENFQSSLLM